jgi:hypothetical protein
MQNAPPAGRTGRRPFHRPTVLITLLALLALPVWASAQTCLDDVTGRPSYPCTAGDVRIASLTILNLVDGCGGVADTFTVQLRAEYVAGANTRFDVGSWVALDGGNARAGSCYRDYLPPPLADLASYNPCTTGAPAGACVGPYYDAEDPPGSGDECGDIDQGVSTYYDLPTLTLPCVDNNGDGFVDPIGTCVAWDNQNDVNCFSVNDALPGTGSKCNCEPAAVQPPIEVPPTGCTTDAECSDGNFCNGVELCDDSQCVPGTPPNCDDQNVCTVDSCNEQLDRCDNVPIDCDDGDRCNGPETCDPDLGCQPGTPLNCDDGNVCNGAETCDPVDGCQPGTPLNCDDGNRCNGTETCSPTAGCQPGTPLNCDDGLFCNGVETCNPSAGCQPGSPPNCDDQNPCTVDSCNEQLDRCDHICETVPPSLSGVPGDASFQCQSQVPPPATVTASDNCALAPGQQPVFQETRTPDPTCPNNVTITRRWTATDTCGNQASATQTITVRDTTGPTLSGVPGNVQAECNAVPPPAAVTASDNCSTAPIAVTFNETRTPGNCPNNYTLTRTWTATDACGNPTSASQTITVRDTQGPTLSGVPANATAECDAVPPPATVTAADNCDATPPTVQFSETRTDGSCPDDYTLTRTWTATDACGNPTTASQTVQVMDTMPPTVDGGLVPTTPKPPFPPASPASVCSAPSSRTFLVDCGGAIDNCDPAPVTTAVLRVHIFEVVPEPQGPACIERVEDVPVDCGEEITFELLAPQCPRKPRSPRPAVTVTSSGQTVVQGDAITVDFVATDRCGNIGTASHDPTVEPSPACEYQLPDGTCCPAIQPPPPPSCKVELCPPAALNLTRPPEALLAPTEPQVRQRRANE